jgi:ATP-dependent helicase HrpA
MAAELVETNRLYARRVAQIEPQWAEKIGAHAVKRSHGDVRWDSKAGRAVVTETVTLYGLPIVSDRIVGYDRVDLAEARAWFITKALVEGDVADEGWAVRNRFIGHNGGVLDRIRRMAERARRLEIVDDEMLFEFFDDRVGDDVTSTRHFDRWWKATRREEPHLLDLDTQRDLLDRYLEDYPDMWRQRLSGGEIELPLTYRYAPGEPLDGVTVHLPLAGLNQVTEEGFDWQVPGHREELVTALTKSLPKQIRRQLIPLSETIEAVVGRLESSDASDAVAGGRMTDALADALTAVSGVVVSPQSLDPSVVPAYLQMHFVVSDDEGTVRGVGTDLEAIKASLAGSARESVAAAAPIDERRGITQWDLGDLPQVVESTDRALDVRAYPVLLDVGESVSLRVVTTPELQHRVMHAGVRRLLILTAGPTRKSVQLLLDSDDRLAIASGDIPLDVLADDCIAAAVDDVMREHANLPWNEADFDELRREVKRTAPGLASHAMAKAAKVVSSASITRDALGRMFAEALRPSVNDANAHLGRLVRPGFVLSAGIHRLDDIDRYVRAVNYRLEHLAGATDRDRRRMAEVAALEHRYTSLLDATGSAQITPALVDVGWMLEDFRVATFAQPLVVKRPGAGSASAKRITQALNAV